MLDDLLKVSFAVFSNFLITWKILEKFIHTIKLCQNRGVNIYVTSLLRHKFRYIFKKKDKFESARR